MSINDPSNPTGSNPVNKPGKRSDSSGKPEAPTHPGINPNPGTAKSSDAKPGSQAGVGSASSATGSPSPAVSPAVTSGAAATTGSTIGTTPTSSSGGTATGSPGASMASSSQGHSSEQKHSMGAKHSMGDKARETSENLMERARDTAKSLSEKVHDRVGDHSFSGSSGAGSSGRQLARRMQNSQAGSMASRVGQYTRENPAVVLGGALLTGFLIARLMRSSKKSHAQHSSQHSVSSGYDRNIYDRAFSDGRSGFGATPASRSAGTGLYPEGYTGY